MITKLVKVTFTDTDLSPRTLELIEEDSDEQFYRFRGNAGFYAKWEVSSMEIIQKKGK